MHDREPPPFSRAPPPPPASGHVDDDYPAIVTQRARQAPPPSRRRPARRQRRSGSWLGWVLGTIAILVILGGVGVVALLAVMPPGEFVRTQLISQVKANTGRDLVLEGETGISVWPSLAITLPRITIAPPQGMAAPPTLVADGASAELALWPLIEGRAVIEGITLRNPVIDLRRDRAGRTSWTVATLAGPRPPVRYAQAATGTLSDHARNVGFPGDSSVGAALGRLELKNLRIVGGTIAYTDERAGTSERFEQLDLDIRGRSLRDPVTLNGSVAARGDRLKFAGEVRNPSALIEGRRSDIDVKISGGSAQVDTNGALALAPSLRYDGPIELRVWRLDTAAGQFNYALPNGERLGALDVTGTLTATPTQVALNAQRLALGDMQAKGRVVLALNGARPAIDADLDVNAINFDVLSAGFEGFAPLSEAERRRRAPPPQTADRPQTRTAPTSIEDILRQSQPPAGPQVRGYTSRHGWPEAPLPADALRAVDVTAKLRTGPLQTGNIVLDATVSRIAVRDGAGRLNLDAADIYGGKARGIVTMDPIAAGQSRVSANLRTTEPLDAQRFLTALADTNTIAGRANVGLNVTAEGNTVAAVMQRLKGAAEVSMADGALIGWNVAELVRGLSQGRFDGLNRSPSEKTDFSSLKATFDIKDGVATNRDLRLTSPLLRVTGEGQIDIGKRQLNYLARPRVVNSLTGQGASGDAQGFEIPVRIAGSWDNPSYTPELGNVVSNPTAIRDTAREIREQFKGKKTDEVIGDLLKNDGEGARNLLQGIFGR